MARGSALTRAKIRSAILFLLPMMIVLLLVGVNFDLRLDPILVVRLQQFHIRIVETVLLTDRCDFDAFDEAKIIGLDRVEPIDKVRSFPVRCAVTQRHERIEVGNRSTRLVSGDDTLGFIDDDHRIGGLNEFNGPPPGHAVIFAVDDVELLQLVLGHLR